MTAAHILPVQAKEHWVIIVRATHLLTPSLEAMI